MKIRQYHLNTMHRIRKRAPEQSLPHTCIRNTHSLCDHQRLTYFVYGTRLPVPRVPERHVDGLCRKHFPRSPRPVCTAALRPQTSSTARTHWPVGAGTGLLSGGLDLTPSPEFLGTSVRAPQPGNKGERLITAAIKLPIKQNRSQHHKENSSPPGKEGQVNMESQPALRLPD